jgi:hypothetical protein
MNTECPPLPPPAFGEFDPRHQPSVYYYREAIREARTRAEVEELAFALCREWERLREWVRGKGYIPPKWELMEREFEAKPWRAAYLVPELPERTFEVMQGNGGS